ncbi:putative aspartic-type endopeptidase opsB [Colletotrichum liriopes]|uniref:Aspartic-type endopeptidase opsB n=1 Tax=Colletotrichum liriopes TaxID=708192 RepID=A0AA37GUP4_9PEZI|nr:putative aspartic-type endopeptidase opsB [Colletotrichum liriopes]
MRASSLFAATACAAVASAQIRLPFARQAQSSTDNVKPRAPGDRRSIPTLDILANDWSYLVNVSVGTPPQEMSMRLTVQADTSWVPDAQYCASHKPYYVDSAMGKYNDEYALCRHGAFNASKSTTYVNPGTESFSEKYTNDYVSGDWVSDTLEIAGTQVPKLVMGFVRSADTFVGVLGLGFNVSSYSSSSASPSPSSLDAVPTVPERLLKDGFINSTAYSVWLDDKSAKSGNLLLGAIDKSKFEGPLIRFPTSSSVTSYGTRMFDTIISSVNGSKSATDELQPLGRGLLSEEDYMYDSDKINVRLAPDSSFSVLPSALALDIWALAGASWNNNLYYAVIPCAAAETSTGHIVMQLYGIEGPVLNVSIADLVVPKESWSHSEWSWDTESSAEYCLFGVQSDNSTSMSYGSSYSYYLGGAMLKQEYMVFDLANAEIAIAQAKFGSTATENIVPFASYGAKTPESTAATPSYCYRPGYSSFIECGGDDSGSGDGSSGDNDNYGDNGYDDYYDGSYTRSLSQPARIAIGLGVVVFCLLVVCLSVWAVRRCRRIRAAEKELSEKQADVEQVAERTGTRNGNNVTQEGSMPQQPPAAVIREPSMIGTAEGQHNTESAAPARP